MHSYLRSLILALACPLAIKAQPVLTATNNLATPGESFAYISAGYQPAGPSGGGVTWDFSSLQPENFTQLFFGLPSSGSQAVQFPDATLLRSQASGQESYFIHNNDSIRLIGVVTASGVVVSYSDPEQVLRFPFSFNQSFVDSFRASYISGSSGTRTGVDTVVADGWGTLILPDYTYNNVLRVKVISHYNDTIPTQPVLTFNDERYYFYLPGIHSYLLSINNTVVMNGNTVISTVQTLNYFDHTTGIAAAPPQVELKIYPVPALEKADVHFPAIKTDRGSLTVINNAGMIVRQVPLVKNQTQLTLDCLGLPSGMYVVKMYDGEQAAAGKLVVR